MLIQMEMSGMGNTLREYGKLWMAPEVLMDAVTNPTGQIRRIIIININ